MSGQLCLRWNNHNSAFNKLLSRIYLEDTYSDGTILCQGKFYPVHQFVLSTCSEYFEDIFKRCVRLKNKQPFIIVKDIHPEQMEALLNYMYKGEVNVPQEMLPELIKAAEAFKIKGLAVPDEEPSFKHSRKRASASSPSSMPKKCRKQDERPQNSNKDEISSVSNSENISSESISNENSHSDKHLPSTSDTKAEEIYITEPTIPKIKAEPIDVEEPITHVDNTEEGNCSLKQESSSTTDIPNFDSYSGEDSNFEAFDYDAPHENFDPGQAGSWENFQGEEGNEDDPSQRMVNTIRNDDSWDGLVKADGYWKCSLCYYYSVHKHHVIAHYRRHSGIKPYICSFCPYRSTKHGNLKRHMVLHNLGS